MNHTIKEMPESQRPYEKCIREGEGSLSDSELEQLIERRAKEMGSYFCVITIDHNYAYLPHN